MIIDDSRVQRALLKGLLLAEGYQVVEAVSGTLALDHLQHDHNFDLILLDILMPEINGMQTLYLIKNNPLTASIPVMMLTGVKGESEEKQALGLGASSYAKKSASMMAVINLVKEQLAGT